MDDLVGYDSGFSGEASETVMIREPELVERG